MDKFSSKMTQNIGKQADNDLDYFKLLEYINEEHPRKITFEGKL